MKLCQSGGESFNRSEFKRVSRCDRFWDGRFWWMQMSESKTGDIYMPDAPWFQVKITSLSYCLFLLVQGILIRDNLRDSWRLATSYGDHVVMQKIVGDDSGRNAIVQVLRKYFEIRLHSGETIPSNTDEALIIDVLKSYFKSDDWSWSRDLGDMPGSTEGS